MARRKKGERKAREQVIAELLANALKQIGEGRGKHAETFFVKPDRVIRKQDNLDPTEHQEPLLRFIEREKFVPFEQTLGMHWGMLGGLLARGLVHWVTTGGVFGLAPRDRGF